MNIVDLAFKIVPWLKSSSNECPLDINESLKLLTSVKILEKKVCKMEKILYVMLVGLFIYVPMMNKTELPKVMSNDLHLMRNSVKECLDKKDALANLAEQLPDYPVKISNKPCYPHYYLTKGQ